MNGFVTFTLFGYKRYAKVKIFLKKPIFFNLKKLLLIIINIIINIIIIIIIIMKQKTKKRNNIVKTQNTYEE